MDVRMPDGTLVRNVPDNITKEELMAKLGKQPTEPETPSKFTNTKVPDSSLTLQNLKDKPLQTIGAYAIDKVENAKELLGEGLAVGGVIAGAPAFVANAIGTGLVAGGETLGKVAGAIKTGDTSGLDTDWNSIKETTSKVSEPLSRLTKGIDFLVDKFGVRDQFESSLVNTGMSKLSDATHLAGKVVEEKTGIPAPATIALLDIGMLGVGIPGIKPLVRNIKQVAPSRATSPERPLVNVDGTQVGRPADVVSMRPDETYNPDQYVQDSLETPSTFKTPKELDEALYTTNNLSKLDETENLTIREELDKVGVTPEVQEKLRRYDEQQAKGNATINNEIYEVNKKINEVYSDNAAMFKEGGFRSERNPEGTVGWRDFKYKEEVRRNYEKIKALEETRAAIEKRRGTKEQLNPFELDVYNKYYAPRRTENLRLAEYMEKEGIIPEFGRDPTGAFASRKTIPTKLEQSTIWQTWKEALIGKDYTEQITDVNRTANSGKDRTYYVLESPEGVREVIAVSEKPDYYEVLELRNGKTQGKPVALDKEKYKIKTGEKIGDKTIREATVDELELNANRKYLKDYSLVLGESLANLRTQARLHELSKKIAADKDIAWKAKSKYDVAPEGWRQLQFTDKMPELREYYFPERHAEILDDFNQPPVKNALVKFNNTLVTNMMLVPLAHMHNEIFHWGMTKGVSGFLNPKKLLGLKGIVDAAKEVTTRGDFYKEILREGGSMMSTNIKNSTLLDSYYKQSLDVFKETKTFKDLAAAVGKSPANFYAGISKWSNKSMWTVRDILYTQLIKDKMDKGLSMKEAIASVERHMPNYRLPSRLITEGTSGRLISKALGNRHAFLFARYHAGMVGSAKNTIKDLLMLDPNIKKSKQFAEGLDTALGVAVAMGVIYPLFDSVAALVAEVLDSDGSIDPDSVHVRRPGVAHVFQTLWDISEKEKDPYAAFSILVTPTPAMSLMFESAWNYEFYNRRDIRTPGADPEIQADEYASYLINKVPQAGQAIRATGDFGTGLDGAFLRMFLDIQTKSPDQMETMDEQKEKAESRAANINDEYGGLFYSR